MTQKELDLIDIVRNYADPSAALIVAVNIISDYLKHKSEQCQEP